MRAQQLCFFKFDRPLVELLGRDFFRRAPTKPGVYLFFGEARRVLYVGQSKNLRSRLSYYKNAQPEREPRRIIRMVHQTRSIEWQICESSTEALAREIELIQEHRPRFNVQHALSRTYSFFAVSAADDSAQCRVRLTLDESAQPEETVIGAFKNRGLCRRALFALARALWRPTHSPENIFELPMALMDRPKINSILLNVDASLHEELTDFLAGVSARLVNRSDALLQAQSDPFLSRLAAADHLILVEFFQLAERMQQLRKRSGLKGVLPQQQVDRVRFTA